MRVEKDRKKLGEKIKMLKSLEIVRERERERESYNLSQHLG